MTFQFCHGDCLILFNVPGPSVAKLIEDRQWGCQAHHCAICLRTEDAGYQYGWSQLHIYDARPFWYHKVTVPEYLDTMRKWAGQHMRWREEENRWLRCEVYRPPPDLLVTTDLQPVIDFCEAAAADRIQYDMIRAWIMAKLFGFDANHLHCSEALGTEMALAKWCEWDKPMPLVTPLDCLNVLRDLLFERLEVTL